MSRFTEKAQAFIAKFHVDPDVDQASIDAAVTPLFGAACVAALTYVGTVPRANVPDPALIKAAFDTLPDHQRPTDADVLAIIGWLSNPASAVVTTPTPTSPPIPTPSGYAVPSLSSHIIRLVVTIVAGLVIGLWSGGWGWTGLLYAAILGFVGFKLAKNPERRTRWVVGGMIGTVLLVTLAANLITSVGFVQRLVGKKDDVTQVVGPDAEKSGGTATPVKPTEIPRKEPVGDLLRNAHRVDAQKAVDLLKPLAGDVPGGKAAVELLEEDFDVVRKADAAGKGILASDKALFDSFDALRKRLRYSKREAIEKLDAANTLQARIEKDALYGEDVPGKVDVILTWAKAQTDQIDKQKVDLKFIKDEIAKAPAPTVPVPVKDADEAARARKLEAERKLLEAERMRIEKLKEARKELLAVVDDPELQPLIALIVKGDRTVVRKGNDERLLLVWNVHFLAELKGPADVKRRMEYALQFLPTSAAKLKIGEGVWAPATEWVAGPPSALPADTEKWKWRRQPYNTNATWTRYNNTSGRGTELYKILEGQFQDKFQAKLSSIATKLPEAERVMRLEELVWIAVQCRPAWWLSDVELANLKSDPTIETAGLWTRDIAGARIPSTAHKFMTSDEWMKRP